MKEITQPFNPQFNDAVNDGAEAINTAVKEIIRIVKRKKFNAQADLPSLIGSAARLLSAFAPKQGRTLADTINEVAAALILAAEEDSNITISDREAFLIEMSSLDVNKDGKLDVMEIVQLFAVADRYIIVGGKDVSSGNQGKNIFASVIKVVTSLASVAQLVLQVIRMFVKR